MANSGSKAESPFQHFLDGRGGIWEGVGPPYDLTVLGCDNGGRQLQRKPNTSEKEGSGDH